MTRTITSLYYIDPLVMINGYINLKIFPKFSKKMAIFSKLTKITDQNSAFVLLKNFVYNDQKAVPFFTSNDGYAPCL